MGDDLPQTPEPAADNASRRRQLSGRLWRLVVKELREILRDRRTIITLVVMPILIYPLLAIVFQRFLLTSLAVDRDVQYVIGVDSDGLVTIVNRSAETMLALPVADTIGRNISSVLPHVGRVFEIARDSSRPVYREQVTFYRTGAERTFNVQITVEGPK